MPGRGHSSGIAALGRIREMNRLEKNQLDFINLRLGTFIHFNSATVQFHSSEIIDWEFDHENGDEPRLYPIDENDW